MELVLVDTVRGGRLADVTGAASEHELVGSAVFLRVEQVGAVHLLATGPRDESLSLTITRRKGIAPRLSRPKVLSS